MRLPRVKSHNVVLVAVLTRYQCWYKVVFCVDKIH